MLIYENIIKFKNVFYLCIEIKKHEFSDTIKFKLIKNKILVQELIDPIYQKDTIYIYKLKRNLFTSDSVIRLYYEKNGNLYYVDSLNEYDCMIVDENQISYKIIKDIKNEFLTRIRDDQCDC